MRKLFRLLLLIPAAIVMVSLAVSNRDVIGLGLEPLPFVINLPLYVIIFGAIFAGILVGGMAMWWRDGRVRRYARGEHSRVAELEDELQKARAELQRVRRLARLANDPVIADRTPERKRLQGPEAA